MINKGEGLSLTGEKSMENICWIDTHTHLNMLKERGPKDVIEDCKPLGIEKFITIGTDSKDHPVVLDLANTYEEVFCTLGVHPHDAEDFENAKDFMVANLNHKKVLAVGEIGLDFYYDNAPRELQKSVYNEQMQIAEKFNLPVEVHTRDADLETIEMIKKYEGKVNGLLHCFSGSAELAQAAVDSGYHISISGIITFKSAKELRRIVKEIVPLDRIHVETDAPFLAPIPHRGKENYSGYMIETAKVVAELKEISMDELKKVTYENNMRLFKKLK